MQVHNINNKQENTAFKAKVDYILDSEKYFSKKDLKSIADRAKALGTDMDTIVVSVGYKGVFKEVVHTYLKGGFLGAFFGISPSVETKKYNQQVGLQHYLATSGIFPSINHIEHLKNEDLPIEGSVKENAGKYLGKYLDYLEGLFKEKRSKY